MRSYPCGTRVTVKNADRAYRKSFTASQKCARVEPQPFVGRDKRIAGKPGICAGVGDHKKIILQDRVGANRNIERQLADAYSRLCHEPLAVAGHQIYDGYWGAERVCCETDDIVELGFR